MRRILARVRCVCFKCIRPKSSVHSYTGQARILRFMHPRTGIRRWVHWCNTLLPVPQPIPQCPTRYLSPTPVFHLVVLIHLSRFCRVDLTLWQVLQIRRPWPCKGQCLHRKPSRSRCQSSDQSHWQTDRYYSGQRQCRDVSLLA